MRNFPVRSIFGLLIAVALLTAGCTQMVSGNIIGLRRSLPETTATALGEEGKLNPEVLSAGDIIDIVGKELPVTNSAESAATVEVQEEATFPAAAEPAERTESRTAASKDQAQSELAPVESKPQTSTALETGPVAYVWGSPKQFKFVTQVQVTNSGSEVAANVWVDLPMLENNSPYQSNVLTATNYEIAYTAGRIASFGIGDIQPGETKTVTADYTITVRPVSLRLTNETVENARQAYLQFAGSGNCLTLATGFVNRARELGVTARLVNGFARAQRGNMTSGSLQGSRHTWAEFYVDGLGWVPVDLTFSYFGELPYASHIIETYVDQSVKVYNLGGSLSVTWQNSIL